VASLVLLFALDELRSRYGHCTPAGVDARQDTTAFRVFRATLLDALAAVAIAPAELSMWWEGGFDGYSLAVAIDPADAVPDGEAAAAIACSVDDSRVGLAWPDRYLLAHIQDRTWNVARDDEGAAAEAPFGAATGHFGAPGMRRTA
jgi:hypothetical protein